MILRTAILKEDSLVLYKDFIIYYYLGGFKKGSKVFKKKYGINIANWITHLILLSYFHS